MQPVYGRLESKDPRAPKPIYVLIESEERISIYTEPNFTLINFIGYIGNERKLKRLKRGFLFSTFELKFAEDAKIEYATDNKFGDFLNLFISQAR